LTNSRTEAVRSYVRPVCAVIKTVVSTPETADHPLSAGAIAGAGERREVGAVHPVARPGSSISSIILLGSPPSRNLRLAADTDHTDGDNRALRQIGDRGRAITGRTARPNHLCRRHRGCQACFVQQAAEGGPTGNVRLPIDDPEQRRLDRQAAFRRRHQHVPTHLFLRLVNPRERDAKPGQERRVDRR
jgi:hypothetical protein